jgi:hypothetical protein
VRPDLAAQVRLLHPHGTLFATIRAYLHSTLRACGFGETDCGGEDYGITCC